MTTTQLVGLDAEDLKKIVRDAMVEAERAKRSQVSPLLVHINYLTTAQAAAVIGVSEQTIRSWTKRGYLTAATHGKAEKYRLTEVLEKAETRRDYKAAKTMTKT